MQRFDKFVWVGEKTNLHVKKITSFFISRIEQRADFQESKKKIAQRVQEKFSSLMDFLCKSTRVILPKN